MPLHIIVLDFIRFVLFQLNFILGKWRYSYINKRPELKKLEQFKVYQKWKQYYAR